MKNQVDYKVLSEFLDYDDLQLEYDRVTNNIDDVDIEYGVDVIFKYYRKFGFPHYKIREEEKHQHMKKLQKFDVNTILDGVNSFLAFVILLVTTEFKYSGSKYAFVIRLNVDFINLSPSCVTSDASDILSVVHKNFISVDSPQ